jgi:glucosylglycerate synthase
MEGLPEEIEQRIGSIGTADIVIGIPTHNNVAASDGVLSAAQAGLPSSFAGARSVIVHVEAGAKDMLPDIGTVSSGSNGDALHVLRFAHVGDGMAPMGSGPKAAKAVACRTVFEVARRLRAKACGIIDAEAGTPPPEAIARLIKPIVQDSYDFVAPVYARGAFSGTLTSAVAYPLTRALFGKRVRQPLAGDFACSTRLVERFVALDAWRNDVPRMGIDFWVTTQAITAGGRLCQVHLGPRGPSMASELPHAANDLRDTLPAVLSGLFISVERTEAVWQKIRGSEPVDAFGSPQPATPDESPFDVRQCLEAFRLGVANLHEIWGLVLPPTSLHALRKLATSPDSSFSLPDELWARLVYDFALAFHQRRLGREHLLTAFIPLYWAWVAAYAQHPDVQNARAEERLDELSQRFETEKPYFIARWRSPDRFAP